MEIVDGLKKYNCQHERQRSGGMWMSTGVADLGLFSHSWAPAGAKGEKD